MAAKTPNLLSTLRAAPTTSAWIEPTTGRGVIAGTVFKGVDFDYRKLQHRVFYFDNIDTTDTWASGITGILEVAAYDNAGVATVLAGQSAPGTIAFVTSADNLGVVLHVWSQV